MKWSGATTVSSVCTTVRDAIIPHPTIAAATMIWMTHESTREPRLRGDAYSSSPLNICGARAGAAGRLTTNCGVGGGAAVAAGSSNSQESDAGIAVLDAILLIMFAGGSRAPTSPLFYLVDRAFRLSLLQLHASLLIDSGSAKIPPPAHQIPLSLPVSRCLAAAAVASHGSRLRRAPFSSSPRPSTRANCDP